MELALILLAAVSGLELLIWLPGLWRWRRYLSCVPVILLPIVTGRILSLSFSTWSVILLILGIYRVFNLLRVTEDRVQADFLYHATRTTAWWLIGLQAAVIALTGVTQSIDVNILTCFYVLAGLQLVAAAVIAASTRRHIRTTRPPFLDSPMPTSQLPAVTVAIPARNETKELEECLRSLLASDYPKLEILVLDDCSQNKQTPEIIRSFAHDGVRFVAGDVPPDSWLAKNYAYKQLAETANGEILLFCGVDSRFEPGSVRALVETMLGKKKSMLSILPRNQDPSLGKILVQPNRYAWELALPRRWLGRPPVLSTCWLITKEALRKAGGFEAASRKSVPESYLAKATAGHGDGYSFLRSDATLGVSTTKSYEEQLSTAVRTRYTQLHRRPELVALVTAGEFMVLVWPLVVGVLSIVSGEWPLAILSGVGFLLVAWAHARIVNLTYRKFMLSGLFILPIAAIYDICLLNYSMRQYEFSEVIWKGRNVCLPVMRVYRNLPPA
jgi:glycosyltransferase involved in cell wall biosynthesis